MAASRFVWFYLWTKNRFVDDWYLVDFFNTLASCKRYAERVLDKHPSMSFQFKFEKVVFFNDSVVEREFIA